MSEVADDVYRDRNLLALAFLGELRRSTRAALLLHGRDPDDADRAMGWWNDEGSSDDWAVVWADLPAGQVGWHVPRELVPEWLDERNPEYDGYTTAEKNDRLATYAGLEEGRE